MTDRTPYGNDTLIVPAFFTTDTNQAECEAWKRDHPTWFVAGTWTPAPRQAVAAERAREAVQPGGSMAPRLTGPAPMDETLRVPTQVVPALWTEDPRSVAPRARHLAAAAARSEDVTLAQYRGGRGGPTRLPGGGMAELTPAQELLVARLNFALGTIRRLEPNNSWGQSLSPANQVPSEGAVLRVEAEADAARERARPSGTPNVRPGQSGEPQPGQAPTGPLSPRPRLQFNDWDAATRELRQNLINAGEMAKDDQREAHHIVPKGGSGMSGDRNPATAQGVLRKFGIDINSPANGVALPRGYHQPIHTADYYQFVNNKLEGANTRQEVLDILKSIKNGLLSSASAP